MRWLCIVSSNCRPRITMHRFGANGQLSIRRLSPLGKKKPAVVTRAFLVHSVDLYGVVHIEFDGVCGHVQTLDLTFLQLDVAIDHVVSEYAAAGEELPVSIQRV